MRHVSLKLALSLALSFGAMVGCSPATLDFSQIDSDNPEVNSARAATTTAPALAYAIATATYTRNVPISTNIPSSLVTVISYSISPALPAGLVLDTSNGRITGTPTTLSAATVYTVTGTPASGSPLTCSVTIAVNDISPSALSYSQSPAIYTRGTVIATNTFSNAGGTVVSFSVTPALPTGLSLDSVTGNITGTPTAATAASAYVITASNTGGASSVSLTITVNDIAPTSLTYSSNPATYGVGSAITTNTPSVGGGGTPTSYSVTPALPAGLSLNASTGQITGTPTALTATAAYTISATNSGGSASVNVTVTVNDAAPGGLSYSSNPATYTRTSAISTNSPSSSGGAVVSYSVSPALPAGLSLNAATGAITGTPTAVVGATAYTVTATNSGGSTTANVSITIIDIAPTGLTYTAESPTYTEGAAIAANNPSSGGGAVVSYSVSPALPAGLSLNSGTGVISGTPSVITSATTYTVTAANTGGSTTRNLTITVNAAAPSALTYTTNSPVYTKNSAISANTPSASGGAVVSYSVSPALPAGLSLNTGTGVITGTPSVAPTSGTYTVTATNTGGSATRALSIVVNDVGTGTVTYSSNPAGYTILSAITSNTPSVSGGGAVDSWSISPALPTGLSLSTTTGVITGTPTVLSANVAYTVTATNTGGSSTMTLNLAVIDVPPSALSYTSNSPTYTAGTAITANSPSSGGGAVVSYSVSPALPAGLNLNTGTGVITGTPAAASAATSYTVTATNSGGTATRVLNIAVNDAAPTSLAYSTNPAIYVRSNAIAANSPSNAGGAITSYSVAPALPAGLSLNTSTGLITGTPTTITAAANYIVTGTGTGGSTNVALNLTVTDIAPSALSYTDHTPVYIVGTAISTNSPSSSGGTVVTYGISPALPAGLSLDTNTGAITGTPTAATALANYTVTATNTGGSTTRVLAITVNSGAPSGLTYSTSPATYTVGTAIADNTPASGGGAVVSYSVLPALPAGLALNTSSGVISGTPSAVSSAATYTVTATNTGGSTSVGLSITVNDVAPSALTYTDNAPVYTKDSAIASNSPGSAGGAVTAYSVSPALPAGLSIHATTGVVTGTPTAIAALGIYIVTASNSGGSTTRNLNITINDIAPSALTYTNNAPVYTQLSAITDNSPSSSGGPVVSYSVSPALPAGLTINASTGVISGTPTVAVAAADYTVTATNTGGSTTRAVNITVQVAPPAGLTYSNASPTYPRSAAITVNTASSTGGTIASYSVFPALPAGLTLNATTGIISGTPTTETAAAAYTVTATNAAGSTTASLTITISVAAPTFLSYGILSPTYFRNVLIAPNNPLTAGGAIATYSVSPALPTGLSLNTSTGVITGTPTAITASASYTVTGSNVSGSVTANLTIAVSETPPAFLSYSTPKANYLQGAAITNNSPSSSGGPIASYSISPALPAGLSLDTASGVISGTPAVGASLASYLVTATGPGGSSSASIEITVTSGAPVGLSYTAMTARYLINSAITSNSPTTTGGIPTSYGVAPALPTGLNFNTSTGVISGTPTANSAAADYTVTASNGSGSTTATLRISVSATGVDWVGAIVRLKAWVTGGLPAATIASGGFQNPSSVIVDAPRGIFYVLESQNHRISRFNLTTGAFTGWIGKIGIPPTGGDAGCAGSAAGTYTPGWCLGGTSVVGLSGFGGFNGSQGMAYDQPTQTAWVADTSNQRIARFNLATGAFTGWIGRIGATVPTGGDPGCTTSVTNDYSPGWCTGGNSMSSLNSGSFSTGGAWGIVYDGTHLYVADRGGKRIQKWVAATGAYVGWIGRNNGVPTGGVAGCTAIATGATTPGWCVGGLPHGTAAVGDGNYNAPSDVAVDGAGYLYVADTSFHRVQRINAATGAPAGWIGRVGTMPTGGDAGCSSTSSGNYTPGWCTGGSAAGNAAANGSMNSAASLFIDSTGGLLYVLSAGSGRVDRYNLSTGAHQGWIGRVSGVPTGGVAGCTSTAAGASTPGWCVGGSSAATTAATDGQIGGSSSGLRIDLTNGTLFVADAGNHRINKYALTSGAYQGWLGNEEDAQLGWSALSIPSMGGGNNGFNSPRGAAYDSAGGYVYVLDQNNHRVARVVASSGAAAGWVGYIAQDSSPVGGGYGCAGATGFTPAWCMGGKSASNAAGFQTPRGLAYSPSTGYIYVAESLGARVARIHASTGMLAGWIGRIQSSPTGGAAGCIGAGAGTFTPGWCTGGAAVGSTVANGSLSSPYGIAIDESADRFYVIDQTTNRINKYVLSTGAFVGWIGKISTTPTGGDAGCATAAVGDFTPGWCMGGASVSGTAGDGNLNAPYGISFNSVSGHLYVADSLNRRIVRYVATTGAFDGWIGRVSTTPTGGQAGCAAAAPNTFTPGWCTGGTATTNAATDGSMMQPFGVGVSPDGATIYVADSSNKINKYASSNGAFGGWMGRVGSTAPAMSGPGTCATTPVGVGTPGFCFGGTAAEGYENGEFDSPNSVATDNTGSVLFITDDNHRVTRVRF